MLYHLYFTFCVKFGIMHRIGCYLVKTALLVDANDPTFALVL